MENTLYKNNTYKVIVGTGQEVDQKYKLYQVYNLATDVVEYESTILIEALEAADFFANKLVERAADLTDRVIKTDAFQKKH